MQAEQMTDAAAAEQAAPPGVAVRILPPEDWPRLTAYPPFDTGGLPDPQYWRMIVAERGATGGPIVAFVCLWTALHCEPVWFTPELRHHPKVFMDLWRAARQQVEAAGAQMVFATVDDDRPDLQALWGKFGFVAAPGRLYVGDLDRLP